MPVQVAGVWVAEALDVRAVIETAAVEVSEGMECVPVMPGIKASRIGLAEAV